MAVRGPPQLGADRPRHASTPDWQAAAERAQPAAPGFDDGVVLDELICTLDPDRREAFLLTQVLGLPYADAAHICRCPIGTIRSRVARARDDPSPCSRTPTSPAIAVRQSERFGNPSGTTTDYVGAGHKHAR